MNRPMNPDWDVLLIISIICGVLVMCLGAVAAVLASRLRRTERALRGALSRHASLRRGAEFYRMIAEHANDGVVVHGLDGKVTWANPAYCEMMGRPLWDMIGRNPLAYALPPDITPPPEEIARFRYDPDDPQGKKTQLFRNMRADGTEFWNQISVAFYGTTGDQDTVILICRDVTEQVSRENDLRVASNRLEHAAAHDALTGLANRSALMDFVARHLGDERHGRLGLLHIDLDRFKEINDTHGHSAGDAVLSHVGNALIRSLRPQDLAARLGGDEFVVACPNLPTLAALGQVGERLMEVIAEPLPWGGRMLQVRASVGADLAPEDETDIEALLQRSDFALYEAKRAGRAQLACYDEEVHQRHVAAKELATDLTEAIRSAHLGFAFQPILDLSVGQITTVETLVRWNHPRRGPLSPAVFLPVAEELGLLAELDFLAMTAALDLKARLNAQRPSALTVTVNASAALLGHPDFVPRLRDGMAARGLHPAEIGIEVLETVVFDEPGSGDPTSQTITDLRAAGHPVMLDDFGVGYAGLAHLAHLDVTGIKIDLSLVQAAKTDPTSVRILETMIELCGRLGLTSIAEGVDTVWMATRLQDMGCTRVQGWWLSPALPESEILGWLAGHGLPPPIAPDRGTGYAPADSDSAENGHGQLPVRLSHGSGVQDLPRGQEGL
jgi:diguanylate cyclase (GGDEF)-like protein/PAS domain S-box-containing protein